MPLLNTCCNIMRWGMVHRDGSTYTGQHTQKMAYMPHVGFETVTPALEHSEAVRTMQR